MEKNNKNLKIYVAFTAIIGTIAATVAALLHFKNKKRISSDEIEDDLEDFDTIDFSSIDNDTPRDYVSIKINNNDNN
ncbi:MAG: hypothetical protein Q4F11_01435 [Eubacteriales bacterium]|nr:hypothetical protein [Eubacteriales bacterium]